MLITLFLNQFKTVSKSDQENQVISYLDQMIAGKCYDFKILPDSLVKALDEGNRLLVIHEMK